jgi:hypothetical protein
MITLVMKESKMMLMLKKKTTVQARWLGKEIAKQILLSSLDWLCNSRI